MGADINWQLLKLSPFRVICPKQKWKPSLLHFLVVTNFVRISCSPLVYKLHSLPIHSFYHWPLELGSILCVRTSRDAICIAQDYQLKLKNFKLENIEVEIRSEKERVITSWKEVWGEAWAKGRLTMNLELTITIFWVYIREWSAYHNLNIIFWMIEQHFMGKRRFNILYLALWIGSLARSWILDRWGYENLQKLNSKGEGVYICICGWKILGEDGWILEWKEKFFLIHTVLRAKVSSPLQVYKPLLFLLQLFPVNQKNLQRELRRRGFI